MQEWLKKSANPVDKEDLERHDKWLCMMWPRVMLLRELLAEDGSIWITLDDNEFHRFKILMDEVFGEDNFISSLVWQKKYSTKSDTKYFSEEHDFLLVYAKKLEKFELGGLARTEKQDSIYKNLDNDSRGLWTSDNLLRTEERDYAIYDIESPTGLKHRPPKGSSWRFNKDKIEELIKDDRIWFGEDGNNKPRLKRFLSEVRDSIPAQTIWKYADVSHSDAAKKRLVEMFQEQDVPFATPKPVELIDRILTLIQKEDALILDSFAGSGTTGHAVLAANKRDNGARKFILIECESYAYNLTAERIRRAIEGYAFTGTQRDELLTEKISWSLLEKKHASLLQKVAAVEAKFGSQYDNIKKEIKDNTLTVIGERKTNGVATGVGGSFSYCDLGEAIQVESLLSGTEMPSYEALARYVFYTATGRSLHSVAKASIDGFIGETDLFRIHLFYQPDQHWLRSNDAALNSDKVKAIVSNNSTKKRTIVFAVAKFMSQKELTAARIEFCQLPYAIHRIMGA